MPGWLAHVTERDLVSDLDSKSTSHWLPSYVTLRFGTLSSISLISKEADIALGVGCVLSL